MGAEIVDIGSVIGTFIRENGERSKCLVSGQEVEKREDKIRFDKRKENRAFLAKEKKNDYAVMSQSPK